MHPDGGQIAFMVQQGGSAQRLLYRNESACFLA